jgi:hypothetical protein
LSQDEIPANFPESIGKEWQGEDQFNREPLHHALYSLPFQLMRFSILC